MKIKQEDSNKKSNKKFEPKLLIPPGNEILNDLDQDENNRIKHNLSNNSINNMLFNSTNNFASLMGNLGQKQNSNLQQQQQDVFQEPVNYQTLSQRNSEQNLRGMNQQGLTMQPSNPNFMGQQIPNEFVFKMYQDSYENLFRLNSEQQQQQQQQDNFSQPVLPQSQTILPHSQGMMGSNPNIMGLAANDPNFLQLQNIKGNVKNTYIKKISNILTSNNSLDQLVSQTKSGMQAKDFEDSDEDFQSYDENSNQGIRNERDDENNNNMEYQEPQVTHKKQKKNRESARNSRQRKKIYIDLLEKKVQDLNSQIGNASEYITRNWSLISQILQLTPYLRYLINWRHNYVQKMHKQLSILQTSQTQDQEQLGMVIDSFRLRLGATGQLRKNSINFLFDHLLRSFLYNTYPYFLFGYSPDQENEDEEYNNCVQIFKDCIGLKDSSQIYRVLPILRELIKHRERFRNIVVDVYKIKKAFQKCTQRIELMLDNFSPYVESKQIGEMITKVDDNRKKNIFQLNVKRSFSKLEKQEESVDQVNLQAQLLQSAKRIQLNPVQFQQQQQQSQQQQQQDISLNLSMNQQQPGMNMSFMNNSFMDTPQNQSFDFFSQQQQQQLQMVQQQQQQLNQHILQNQMQQQISKDAQDRLSNFMNYDAETSETNNNNVNIYNGSNMNNSKVKKNNKKKNSDQQQKKKEKNNLINNTNNNIEEESNNTKDSETNNKDEILNSIRKKVHVEFEQQNSNNNNNLQ